MGTEESNIGTLPCFDVRWLFAGSSGNSRQSTFERGGVLLGSVSGTATWYSCDCCCGCTWNCVCTDCSKPNSGTECCTACCEACDDQNLQAGAYCNLTKFCVSGAPSLTCNRQVSIAWPCGNTIPVVIYDQLSPCNSGTSYGCAPNRTGADLMDMAVYTFLQTGASLSYGRIDVTMTY